MVAHPRILDVIGVRGLDAAGVPQSGFSVVELNMRCCGQVVAQEVGDRPDPGGRHDRVDVIQKRI